MNNFNGNVSPIISKLESCFSNRAMATEVFGSPSFGRKELDGNTLLKLAEHYKNAYKNWLDTLSSITPEVAAAWDKHLKVKSLGLTEEQIKTLSPDVLATLGLA